MKRILKITLIFTFTIITMVLFSGCFFESTEDKNVNNNSNNNTIESPNNDNKEFIESLKKVQDATYKVFKDVYDDIDGRVSYSDIGYAMDQIEIKLYSKGFRISETYPTGSIFYVKWIGYYKSSYTSYQLVYLEVQFNQNFKASKKSLGKYALE